MTDERKKKIRKIVERDGWTIIWACAPMPCAVLDEEVELMYEDMDGNACVCEARYTREHDWGAPRFIRCSDGARMGNLIAWRYKK